MFNANELKEGVGHSMDSSVGVWDVFSTIQATPSLFKTLTNQGGEKIASHDVVQDVFASIVKDVRFHVL
jgi:hypothetical protein